MNQPTQEQPISPPIPQPTAPHGSTPSSGSASLWWVDPRSLFFAAALFAGFGTVGGGVSYVTGGRMPEDARAAITTSATASTAAASSAAAAAKSADDTSKAIAVMATQLANIEKTLTQVQERASYSDKERERLERLVEQHEARLRALEGLRR